MPGALPCPTCGCEAGCAICQSPNESTPTITVNATIDNVTNISCGGNRCNTHYGGTTHVWDMDLLEDDPDFCYGGGYEPGNVCDPFGTGSDARFAASISKPVAGEATLTIVQTNTDIGAFTATATLTLPFDCETFGPITLDDLTLIPGGGFDNCDGSALTLEVSLTI